MKKKITHGENTYPEVIARRDDDNHVLFTRRYRRVNEVASPKSA
jgi:hypothetical protein